VAQTPPSILFAGIGIDLCASSAQGADGGETPGPEDQLCTLDRTGDNAVDKTKIGGVIQYTDVALVGIMAVPDRPGIAAAVFEALGSRGINVLFIAQSVDLNNYTHIVFCVASKDLSHALGLLEPAEQEFGGRAVIRNARVAIVSIFGPDFRERPGIAGVMCRALAKADINILSISTSISSVSCVIDEDRLPDAVAVLKDTFDFHDRWNIAVQ
jgi:aspartate kinase